MTYGTDGLKNLIELNDRYLGHSEYDADTTYDFPSAFSWRSLTVAFSSNNPLPIKISSDAQNCDFAVMTFGRLDSIAKTFTKFENGSMIYPDNLVLNANGTTLYVYPSRTIHAGTGVSADTLYECYATECFMIIMRIN